MKAWIAHRGTYECETTDGIFLDRQKALFWQQSNLTSDKMNSSAWLEEVAILDDKIMPSQLYIVYTVVYNGTQIRISQWQSTTIKEQNNCRFFDKYSFAESAQSGDYICRIWLESEKASEELAIATAAELIAKYKLERADTNVSLVEDYMIKLKKGDKK